ncbi:MAG: hypothetical protein JXP73_10670 [Deltaproteobacteria bacterium]|nr:hypothetical protein [Deltaproteobacteria bacterium]
MSANRRVWPPQGPCFAPRLGEYLARLEQAPLSSLLARPDALARAFRRASELLSLDVECLDVPAAWILRSAGWPATVGERGIALGSQPAALRAPAETIDCGPLLAAREALRSLPPSNTPRTTLIALPSPAVLTQATAGRADWARAMVQALVRSFGESGIPAGVLFDEDDGVTELGRLLDHYQLAPICVRRSQDARPVPSGAMVARALPLVALTGGAPGSLGTDALVTTDGPVASEVAPEDLLRAARTVAIR